MLNDKKITSENGSFGLDQKRCKTQKAQTRQGRKGRHKNGFTNHNTATSRSYLSASRFSIRFVDKF